MTIKVRAAVPLSWLSRGEVAEVERSPLIDGALRNGVLELVAGEPTPEPLLPVQDLPRKRKKR